MSRSYRYVRFLTPQGTGYALFAIEWDKVNGDIDYKVAASFCNPQDSFLKNRARDMANVRLTRKKFASGKLSGLDECKSISNSDFAKMLPVLLDTVPNAPRWAWKTAKNSKNIKFGLTIPPEELQSKTDADTEAQK